FGWRRIRRVCVSAAGCGVEGCRAWPTATTAVTRSAIPFVISPSVAALHNADTTSARRSCSRGWRCQSTQNDDRHRRLNLAPGFPTAERERNQRQARGHRRHQDRDQPLVRTALDRLAEARDAPVGHQVLNVRDQRDAVRVAMPNRVIKPIIDATLNT